MNPGIDQKILARIRALFEKIPHVQEAILFGSRAKGTSRAGSDIDIALKGENITFSDLTRIEVDYEKLYLPWKLDLVIYGQIRNPALKDHIDRVGISLYRRYVMAQPQPVF